MKQVLMVFLSVFFSFTASQALPLQTGFYRFQKQKIVWVYADLISGTKGAIYGNFAVDAKGPVFNSVQSSGQIKLVAANGSVVKIEDFQYLGANQKQAAQALGLGGRNYSPTVYLAHRGTAEIPVLKSSSVFPGNTLAAMDLALQNGYQGFEIDVQLTKDQHFLVAHDQDLSVSTSCTGKVSDFNLKELAPCRVLFTGLIPEQTLLHSLADQPQAMPALEDVLKLYLRDPRISHLVVDTKPGDIAAQVTEFHRLLSAFTEAEQAKIIFLIRDLTIETRLRALGRNSPTYALEGDKGWEPLEGPIDPKAHALSLSLGIGLGLAGDQGQGILSILASLPEFVVQGTLHGWVGGSVDIASIRWIQETAKTFLKLEASWEAKKIPVIGWTINSPEKVNWLRTQAPGLSIVLSDLPFSEIAKLEVAEFETTLALP